MDNGLTIGIPVYNEEARIERAIRSAAPQCARLIVGDNASTDNTGAICERLAQEYPNLRYFRHAENIGALRNGKSILERADTPYLMLLGSHDYLDPDYTSRVLHAIASDDSVEIAIGEIHFIDDRYTEYARAFNSWTDGLHHDAFHRVSSFLFGRAPLEWASYGIFRTSTYRKYHSADLPEYGIDNIFIARILALGRLVVVSNTHYHAWTRKQTNDKSDYLERITASRYSDKTSKRMRNEFRLAQHRELMNLFPSANLARKLALRYLAMVRFGMFRTPGHDMLYYPLYLPVKIARKFARMRRWLRQHARPRRTPSGYASPE
jgi:glycosyltransferase involved in cell wall biosynthesis